MRGASALAREAAPRTDEGVPLMSISTVTIVGAGYMGGGIAQVLAIAGFDVTIADVDVAVADKSLERLQQEARDFEEQGLFAPGSAELRSEERRVGNECRPRRSMDRYNKE